MKKIFIFTIFLLVVSLFLVTACATHTVAGDAKHSIIQQKQADGKAKLNQEQVNKAECLNQTNSTKTVPSNPYINQTNTSNQSRLAN